MSWKSIVCFCVIVLGVVLFLYGSNYYDAVVGWTGTFLAVGGFSALVAFRVYMKLRKSRTS